MRDQAETGVGKRRARRAESANPVETPYLHRPLQVTPSRFQLVAIFQVWSDPTMDTIEGEYPEIDGVTPLSNHPNGLTILSP